MPALPYLGETAALGTALFWTVSAAFFETASKRIGSLAVNIIRLVLAFVFLALLSGLTRGAWLPADAGSRQWIWLSLSGFIGFSLGDLCLFESYLYVGARVSMLVMASAPILTSLLAFLFLGERLSAWALLGILLTACGIGLVVLKPGQGKIVLAHPAKGLLLASGGAIGQAGGLILSKIGMTLPGGGLYPASSSAEIRALAGIAGFALIYSLLRAWPSVWKGFRDRRALAFTAGGAFAGPFIGVVLSLVAVAYARSAGIASCLMSICPVIMVPVSILFLKERVRRVEIAGAFLAVAGVACTFL